MEKELIGLNTYLYTFELAMEKEYKKLIDKLRDEGDITIVFMDNKLAFEIKNKTMKTIPFYEIPNHIDELEFDGDKGDLRLHHQDHINWTEPNKKEYEQTEKELDAFRIKRKSYSIYFRYDVSGYEYWVEEQEEENYIGITVEFNNTDLTLEEVEQLEEDIEEAYFQASLYESYIER